MSDLVVATVVVDGRLYLFTLLHDRRDARAVFDAFAATIELTPENAVEFPSPTTTFVSPTYGFSFGYIDRGGLTPATELWDPVNQQRRHRRSSHFDGVETGLAAYSGPRRQSSRMGSRSMNGSTSTSRQAGCGGPRSQQEEITIDGLSGRISACPATGRIEATVVADGRLYLSACTTNAR